MAANGADGSASRDVLQAYRLIAADAGWLKRVAEVIHSGLSAEAAVQRVAGELHDRMRRITDPYLRERLADLEDLAGRLLRRVGRGPAAPHRAARRHPPRSPARASRVARLAGRGHRRRGGRGGQSRRSCRNSGACPRISGGGGHPRHVDTAEPGDEAVVDADEGQFVLRPEAEVRRRLSSCAGGATALERRTGPAARTAGPITPTASRSA